MDLKQAEIDKVAAPIIKRLKFDETKLRDVIAGIEDLVKLKILCLNRICTDIR